MMVPSESPKEIDRGLVARNVRAARRNEALSQTELARRSGVDLASVYRVEKGVPTHIRTIRKIAGGLQIVFDDLLLDKGRGWPAHPIGIHRASLAKWFPSEDKRPRLPEDHVQDYQSDQERRRLGRLGFVPCFMCPPLIIPPGGPGIVPLEIFEMLPGPFNAEFYEDGAIYVLHGRIAGTIDGEPFELGEEDWVAFKTKDLQAFGVEPGSEPATILWIGATRLKKRLRGEPTDSSQVGSP